MLRGLWAPGLTSSRPRPQASTQLWGAGGLRPRNHGLERYEVDTEARGEQNCPTQVFSSPPQAEGWA